MKVAIRLCRNLAHQRLDILLPSTRNGQRRRSGCLSRAAEDMVDVQRLAGGHRFLMGPLVEVGVWFGFELQTDANPGLQVPVRYP